MKLDEKLTLVNNVAKEMRKMGVETRVIIEYLYKEQNSLIELIENNIYSTIHYIIYGEEKKEE